MATNTRKIRAAVVPLKDVNLNSHTHGYLDTIHPKDRYGYAVPTQEGLYIFAEDQGLRFFKSRQVLEYVDLLGKLQEVIKAAAATVTIETTYQLIDMVDLVKIDDYLSPTDFDFDNPTEYYDLQILTNFDEKITEIEDFDTKSIKYWTKIKDISNNDRISVTFTSGATSREYEVFFDPVTDRTELQRVYYNDYNNDPQYYDITVNLPDIFYQVVGGGTYTMTAQDLNVVTTLVNSLPTLMNFHKSNSLYENKNGMQRAKRTFNVTTKLEDPFLTSPTNLDTLIQFNTSNRTTRFGMVIYEQGKSIFSTTDYGVKILNTANVLAYGIAKITDKSVTRNILEWSCYRYELTSNPESFLKRKVSQHIPYPTCGVGTVNFLTVGTSTVTRDTPNKVDNVYFPIGASDAVVIYASGGYVSLEHELYYMEFEIKNFVNFSDGGITFGIALYGGTSADVYQSITILGNGFYRVLIEWYPDYFLLSGAPGNLGLMYFAPESSGTAGSITFSITNVVFGVAE